MKLAPLLRALFDLPPVGCGRHLGSIKFISVDHIKRAIKLFQHLAAGRRKVLNSSIYDISVLSFIFRNQNRSSVKSYGFYYTN